MPWSHIAINIIKQINVYSFLISNNKCKLMMLMAEIKDCAFVQMYYMQIIYCHN